MKFTEYILDEAKVSLEVTYIKGVPMPDELKVCSTVYNINQTMDWCIPIIYLVELSHSFKEKYELYMVTYLMYKVECIYFLIKKWTICISQWPLYISLNNGYTFSSKYMFMAWEEDKICVKLNRERVFLEKKDNSN